MIRAGIVLVLIGLAVAVPAQPAAQERTEASPEDRLFGRPEAGADFETLNDFRLGNAVFLREWSAAGEGDAFFDGLGPLFNARSCNGCHINDGRGGVPEPGGGAYERPTILLKLGRPGAPSDPPHRPDPAYGHQLQDFALPGLRAEGRVGVSYTRHMFTFPDGETVELRRPAFRIAAPAHGELHPLTVVSPRIAQPLIGLGLLERIPDVDIRANADPDDADGDGISGRVNQVRSRVLNRTALGRFGWKAAEATVEDQISVAFNRDMGIATPYHADAAGDCTLSQADCRAQPDGASSAFEGLEAHSVIMGWITAYASNLQVPAPRPLAAEVSESGERLFASVGCAACHTPRFTTGPDDDQPHLANRTIAPYTDLLLHDMGPDLADGLPEGEAAGSEWRTPPLWGIGLTASVNDNVVFLHDGRARSVLEAILWHGGEAAKARDAFAALDTADRDRLIAFVKSL